MAVVGWFLCFPAFFFGKKVFFSHARLTPKKKVHATYTKKISEQNATYAKKKVTRLTPKRKVTRLTPPKKSELRLFPQSRYAFLVVGPSPPSHPSNPPVPLLGVLRYLLEFHCERLGDTASHTVLFGNNKSNDPKRGGVAGEYYFEWIGEGDPSRFSPHQGNGQGAELLSAMAQYPWLTVFMFIPPPPPITLCAPIYRHGTWVYGMVLGWWKGSFRCHGGNGVCEGAVCW